MEKFILACLLATGAASGFAEWTKVHETNDFTAFIDFSSISNDGDMRIFWMIQDSKKRNKYGAMSYHGHEQVDCKALRARNLSLDWYSEAMAKGRVVVGSDGNPSSWAEIPSNSFQETILKTVCAK